ncbi:MAG: Calvin cycle protein CP12 [Pseudanabaenaceae cyanobacterium bins.68]|nr:Calvin cycle protein CP12 [Pseudanabaenaceae cyanobacterium bins.68]
MTKLEQALAVEEYDAKVACDVNGVDSPECAAALDAVEEVQAAISHEKQKKTKNSLERFCDDNPEAAECRLYED